MLSSLQNIIDHNQKSHETHIEALAKPCAFCNKHLTKYICPRCNRGYCSVECYRSPGHEECSEGFYKEQVAGEVGGTKGADEEREKMLETLRKYNFKAPEDGGALEFVGEASATAGDLDDFDDMDDLESLERDVEYEGAEEDEEDDEDEEIVQRRKDLERRMAGLSIEEADFEEIWERLDAREREEFVRLAQELEKEEHGGLNV
jgi:hypothetical protein